MIDKFVASITFSLFLLVGNCLAQDNQWEIAGGYSAVATHQVTQGYSVSISDDLTRHWSGEFEHSGYFAGSSTFLLNTATTDNFFLGGPKLRSGGLFGHALFGVLTYTNSGTSSVHFASAIGGGYEFWVSKHFGLRPSADYLFSSTDTNNSDLRLGMSLVYRFGGKTESTLAPARPSVAISRAGMSVSIDENGDVEITDITPGGAADAAGLRPRDLLKSLDGKAVTNPSDVLAAFVTPSPGPKIAVRYMVYSPLGYLAKDAVIVIPENVH